MRSPDGLAPDRGRVLTAPAIAAFHSVVTDDARPARFGVFVDETGDFAPGDTKVRHVVAVILNDRAPSLEGKGDLETLRRDTSAGAKNEELPLAPPDREKRTFTRAFRDACQPFGRDFHANEVQLFSRPRAEEKPWNKAPRRDHAGPLKARLRDRAKEGEAAEACAWLRFKMPEARPISQDQLERWLRGARDDRLNEAWHDLVATVQRDVLEAVLPVLHDAVFVVCSEQAAAEGDRWQPMVATALEHSLVQIALDAQAVSTQVGITVAHRQGAPATWPDVDGMIDRLAHVPTLAPLCQERAPAIELAKVSAGVQLADLVAHCLSPRDIDLLYVRRWGTARFYDPQQSDLPRLGDLRTEPKPWRSAVKLNGTALLPRIDRRLSLCAAGWPREKLIALLDDLGGQPRSCEKARRAIESMVESLTLDACPEEHPSGNPAHDFYHVLPFSLQSLIPLMRTLHERLCAPEPSGPSRTRAETSASLEPEMAIALPPTLSMPRIDLPSTPQSVGSLLSDVELFALGTPSAVYTWLVAVGRLSRCSATASSPWILRAIERACQDWSPDPAAVDAIDRRLETALGAVEHDLDVALGGGDDDTDGAAYMAIGQRDDLESARAALERLGQLVGSRGDSAALAASFDSLVAWLDGELAQLDEAFGEHTSDLLARLLPFARDPYRLRLDAVWNSPVPAYRTALEDLVVVELVFKDRTRRLAIRGPDLVEIAPDGAALSGQVEQKDTYWEARLDTTEVLPLLLTSLFVDSGQPVDETLVVRMARGQGFLNPDVKLDKAASPGGTSAEMLSWLNARIPRKRRR